MTKYPKITPAGTGKKVAVALSGGVDSAVATHVLMLNGYDVTCYYMKCWEDSPSCSSDIDYTSALKVASSMGLSLGMIDLRKEYQNSVFNYLINSSRFGYTPNPDVLCNSEIKFNVFIKKISEIDNYDYIATGHYAKIYSLKSLFNYGIKPKLTHTIGVPFDLNKDQSYFLSRIISLNILQKIIFPLSSYDKNTVREYAKKVGLINFDKPDSQGICFIGNNNFSQFIKRYVEVNPGEVIDKHGEVIGRHDGLPVYTIGQRHGFRINRYSSIPLYVTGKNIIENQLVVGPKDDCYRNKITILEIEHVLGSINEILLFPPYSLNLRIRSLGQLVNIVDLKIFGKAVTITLERPIYAPAPGQFAVMYHDNRIIASGVISER